jgi:pimeloyl-ACP methyl ester carboxylesterase
MRSTLIILFSILIVCPALSQKRAPHFEPGDCPFDHAGWPSDVKLQCGRLIVPEVRSKLQGRTVRLAVAVLPAREQSVDPPLVMLHGGLGESGLKAYTRIVATWPIARHRDIVIYDQRGSGFSQPRLCPEQVTVLGRPGAISTLSTSSLLIPSASRTPLASRVFPRFDSSRVGKS